MERRAWREIQKQTNPLVSRLQTTVCCVWCTMMFCQVCQESKSGMNSKTNCAQWHWKNVYRKSEFQRPPLQPHIAFLATLTLSHLLSLQKRQMVEIYREQERERKGGRGREEERETKREKGGETERKTEIGKVNLARVNTRELQYLNTKFCPTNVRNCSYLCAKS